MPPLNLYARVRKFLLRIAHETAGAACTRLSLRPLLLMRAKVTQSSGVYAARTRTYTLTLFDS
jgi:hypothetical protein